MPTHSFFQQEVPFGVTGTTVIEDHRSERRTGFTLPHLAFGAKLLSHHGYCFSTRLHSRFPSLSCTFTSSFRCLSGPEKVRMPKLC